MKDLGTCSVLFYLKEKRSELLIIGARGVRDGEALYLQMTRQGSNLAHKIEEISVKQSAVLHVLLILPVNVLKDMRRHGWGDIHHCLHLVKQSLA
jgi:hypothetical protein